MGVLTLTALAARRKYCRLSQMQVAKHLGISQSGYWSLETGHRQPSAKERTLVAALLRVKVRDLFPEEVEK